MNKTLRKGQLCPLHHLFYCCGRNRIEKTKAKRIYNGPGVRVIYDQFHPRGFRELCSKAELSRRKLRLLAHSQACFYCHKRFEDFREIVVAHVEPKGMGGARRDDHIDNLTLSHSACNLENGSRRPA